MLRLLTALALVWAAACVPEGAGPNQSSVADAQAQDTGQGDTQTVEPPMPFDAGPERLDSGADVDASDTGSRRDAEVSDALPADLGPADSGEPTDSGRPGVPVARGPVTGIVMVAGGGGNRDYSTFLFRDLVGDRSLPIVVVPTARTPPVSLSQARNEMLNAGFSNVTVLHTTNPSEADTEAFVAPLRDAAGVWFTGGRQWRLADAYLGTRVMVELERVLDRGGVLGGTSAGASIMGSFMVRGDTSGNAVLIGDHTVGFGYLDNVGVDQHVAQRGRQEDLFEFVERFPDQLGIGLDEPIAVVFMANVFEVHGIGFAYVHYRALWDSANNNSERYLRLSAGDLYDVSTLTQQ